MREARRLAELGRAEYLSDDRRKALAAAAERSGPPRGEDRSGGAAAAARGARPLGKPTSIASAPGQSGGLEEAGKRRRRLRRYLWRISPSARWGKCGRIPVSKTSRVLVRAAERVAWLANVFICGAIHTCPVCGPRLRSGRADEISVYAGRWLDDGHGLTMVTLTLAHHAGMRLKAVWAAVSDGGRFIRSGRPWQRFQAAIGYVGAIRALEVTVGWNGWHPHIHLLMFTEKPLGARGLVLTAEYFRQRWGSWADRRGYGPIHPVHGVDVRPCYTRGDLMGRYVAKVQDGWSVGREVAGGDGKGAHEGNRTPMQLLADCAEHGREEDLALWREWEDGSHGRNAITWSRGLRERLGAPEEIPDEDLAEGDDEDAEDIAILPPATFAAMVADADLEESALAAAGRAGLRGLNHVLAARGVPLADPPPRRRREQAQHQGSEGPAP